MKKIQSVLAISLLAAAFSLVSCASNTAGQQSIQLAQAKAQFASQNYAQAFQQLLPLAKAGNADAQYGVGYMYYYGKGVVENKQQAIYWLQKASAQGQQSATKALAAINQAG